MNLNVSEISFPGNIKWFDIGREIILLIELTVKTNLFLQMSKRPSIKFNTHSDKNTQENQNYCLTGSYNKRAYSQYFIQWRKEKR